MTVPSLLKFPGIPHRLVALMHPDSFFTEFKQFAITSMVAIFNTDIFIMRIVHVQVEFTKTMF